MKANNKIHINLDTETKLKLQKQAEALNLSLNQYIAFILANFKIKMGVYQNNPRSL